MTAPSERGKNSYQAEKSARLRSTQMPYVAERRDQLAHRVLPQQLGAGRGRGTPVRTAGGPCRAAPAAASSTRPVARAGTPSAARVEDLGALGEVVGEVLGALAGVDLLGDGVPPGQVRIVQRLDGERPAADGVRLDGAVPLVGAGLAGAHPGERPGLAVGALPDHVDAERVVALPVGGRGHGHQLADHGLGRVATARDRGGHVFDGKASGHDLHRSQEGGGGARRNPGPGFRTLRRCGEFRSHHGPLRSGPPGNRGELDNVRRVIGPAC